MRTARTGGSSVFDVDGVGPVLFERSMRARRVSITVDPVRGVRVAVPRGVSIERATSVVVSKAGWIDKHRRTMEAELLENSEILNRASIMDPAVARASLVERMGLLASFHGYKYNRVFVRNQRTLWGSCSARNNINLNLKLAVLPGELADYVMVHELVHTRIKNHGPRFWAELERRVPGAKRLDAELKGYRLLLA